MGNLNFVSYYWKILTPCYRHEVLRESNFKEDPRDARAARKLSRKNKKETENSAPMMMVGDEMTPLTTYNPRTVGKITPSAQSEIDKKSYQVFDQDFAPVEKVEKTPEKKRRVTEKVRYFPSDTDSDFESPSLLARARKPLTLKPKAAIKETTEKRSERKIKEIPKVDNKVEEEEIDIFASPAEEENPVFEKPKQMKTKSIKALNKWGIDKQSFDSLSDSEKRKFSSNRQSKIDGFFKNPPRNSAKDLVRVSHADMDMDRALKLSRDEAKSKEEPNRTDDPKKTSSESKGKLSPNKDEDLKIVDGVARPKFAHVGPTVRGKEERKKLFGFDCPECQEYYQQKLEEGLTKDQILMLMNKCSKHRGLFKPPLTPERFWDADIIEDDPDDPRVKTQPGKPLRTRAVRRAEVRERKRALDLEKAA